MQARTLERGGKRAGGINGKGLLYPRNMTQIAAACDVNCHIMQVSCLLDGMGWEIVLVFAINTLQLFSWVVAWQACGLLIYRRDQMQSANGTPDRETGPPII